MGRKPGGKVAELTTALGEAYWRPGVGEIRGVPTERGASQDLAMVRHDGQVVFEATVLRALRDDGLILLAEYQR